MVKKSFLLVILFVFMFLASGCVTVYTDGCCPDKQPGRKTGKVKTEEGPGIIKQADDWVKQNIW